MQRKKQLTGLLLACFISGATLPEVSYAQNIVTIFGQEKIEKTDEGEVFHVFRNGFLLPGGVNQGTLFNGQDMVAWLYASGKFNTPKEGATLPYSYPAVQPPQTLPLNERFHLPVFSRRVPAPPPTPWQWIGINADSTGRFSSQLRSHYLYMSYKSPREQIAILETTGGTRTYVNGLPHEGDHYDFGYTLIPVKLKKGINEVVHTSGRFGFLTAKLVKPDKPVMFTKRDMTVPDIILGEDDLKWAAIRVINATEKALKEISLRATLSDGSTHTFKTREVSPMTVRKLPFQIPAISGNQAGKVTVQLELLDKGGRVIDRTEFDMRSVSADVHHERTFLSRVDGSAQYYSVAPAIRQTPGETKALVLTVHGAGVEARNQARAYRSKDWTDVVAATNRRPYGFNWEEWGRIDGLEVLEEARRVFKPDNSRIYLTGHSMGGHGSWFLGTTYPDKFAAVAPCAGYPDIATYGSGRGDYMHDENDKYDAFRRGGNAGRTLSFIHNLKQSGVYIFHGDADRVVHTDQARRMREILGAFHPDFCYYEYPGGAHWFGDISVDWNPIFEFFSRHSIPEPEAVKEIDFTTASPAISSSDYWVKIEQQIKPYEFSQIIVKPNRDTIRIEKADNIALFALDIPAMKLDFDPIIKINEQQFKVIDKSKQAILAFENGEWRWGNSVNTKHKYAERYGGFKQAFDNNVVFVYATKGNAKENEWYLGKALFDAETFYYRGNGSIDVIPDTEYSTAKYAGRNVVLYGNKDNNRAWASLLKDCPIQVTRSGITAGSDSFKGNDLATYFVYPHPDSETALVGVVAGTGDAGMRATSNNNYISGITGFPDLMIFRTDMLRDGLTQMEAAGYFDNDWSLQSGDY